MVRIIIGRPFSACIACRTDPHHGCRNHSLLLGQCPERSSAVPASVFGVLLIAHCIIFIPFVIVEIIIDKPMVCRIQAGNQRPVVRESDAWVSWDHCFGFDALPCIFQKVFRVVFCRIIITETVRGNHDYIRLFLCLPAVVAAGNHYLRRIKRHFLTRNGYQQNKK